MMTPLEKAFSYENLCKSYGDYYKTRKKEKKVTLSPPGAAPFTRGPYTTMYTTRPWTIRQYAGFSTAEESNAFYKQNLADGQKGLSVAFDLATHRGYDSDHERVVGDIGKAGVAIDSVEDMKRLFDGIPLQQMSVSMTMNGAVLPVLAFFFVTALENGVPLEQLRGTIQNDILKEYMVRNTYIYGPDMSMRIIGDIFEYIHEHVPKFHAISISGYHLQEAGATPELELAYTLLNGLEYVNVAMEKGMNIDTFAKQLSFFFAIGMNTVDEITKLRVARELWSEMLERWEPKKENSKQLKTHTQTSGWSLTEQDERNNIVRTTIEAFSAVVGHTQSLHTNAFDEAIALPTPYSAKIARHTQLILLHEAFLTEVIDPIGGSLLIEERVTYMKREVQRYMNEITESGSMISAIKHGVPSMRIEEQSAIRQAHLDGGTERRVGVNFNVVEQKSTTPVLIVDGQRVRNDQIQRLQQLKAQRNEQDVQRALHALTECAKTGEGNLLERSIQAAKARATLGEITTAIEGVSPRYEAKRNMMRGVYEMSYEKSAHIILLKELVNEFILYEGRPPRMLVAKIGQDGHDRGAKVVASAFSDFGFEVDLGPLFSTAEEVVKMAVSNDVHIIAISSLAGGHFTFAKQVREELKRYGSEDIVIVVGGVIPQCDYEPLYQEGVKHIFGPGTVLTEAAQQLLRGMLREETDTE